MNSQLILLFVACRAWAITQFKHLGGQQILVVLRFPVVGSLHYQPSQVLPMHMSWQINCCFFYQRQLSTVHLSSVWQLQMYVLATCEPNAGNQTSGKVKYALVWNCLVSAQAIYYIRSTVFPLLVFQVMVFWGTAATVYHHRSPDFCVVVCSYHWLESSKPQQREESSYQWRVMQS